MFLFNHICINPCFMDKDIKFPIVLVLISYSRNIIELLDNTSRYIAVQFRFNDLDTNWLREVRFIVLPCL